MGGGLPLVGSFKGEAVTSDVGRVKVAVRNTSSGTSFDMSTIHHYLSCSVIGRRMFLTRSISL